MNNDILKVLYSKDEIDTACQRLGKEISQAYAGKVPVVIGVLKGAIFFMTDIARHVDGYMQI
ncbi:hypoxanthine phosphoribosyltransferase, partial [Lactobacillus parabuchneri]|nr:hypoxanthine phosphoribosyltransferase [Lentilactobacillus parabuchneri]